MPLPYLVPPSARTSCYTIRGTDPRTGKRISATTHTSIKREADAYLAKFNRDLYDGLLGRRKRSFREAALGYVDAVKPTGPQLVAIVGRSRKDGTTSQSLISDFGDCPVQDVDQEAVKQVEQRRFQVSRYGKPYAPATIVRYLIEPVTAVLNYAAEQGWRDTPKFRHPKYNNKRKRWASVEEVNRLLNASAPHLRPLILFLALEGAREREALALDWENDVFLGSRWAVLRATKRNEEDRGIPLHSQVVEMLHALPHRTGKVFLTNKGLPYATAEITDDGGSPIKSAFRGACRRAKIKDLRPHDLRHTFATWLLMAGSIDRVREVLMGHESQSMAGRYAHVSDPTLADAVDKLPRLDYQLVTSREFQQSVQPKGKGSRKRRRAA